MVLIGSALFFSACAETVNTRGQIILPSRLAQIQPGTTTRDDVVQLLGSPSTQGTMNDERWYYISSSVGTKAFRPHELKSRQIVIIDFDKNTNVVAKVTQKTEKDGKEITPDESTTATQGQSLGIVEQMFGSMGELMSGKKK